MDDVVRPGHKLGQILGNLLEDIFFKDLKDFSEKLGYYCDTRGPRPGVRDNKTKVIWTDNKENQHSMDCVIEKGGSINKQGVPVAFIELAWRRYTKHSRNKSGEMQGSLIALGSSYSSCSFLGAIIAGEYTEGALNQLTSNGITVLKIPFQVIKNAFLEKGVNLDYEENAPESSIRYVLNSIENLERKDLEDVKFRILNSVSSEYDRFKDKLKSSLERRVTYVLVIPLFGNKLEFVSVRDAMSSLSGTDENKLTKYTFQKIEIQIRFSDESEIRGTFKNKESALSFLKTYA